MFSECKKLSYLKVGFGTSGSADWPDAKGCTEGWFDENAGSTPVNNPVFYWKGVDDDPRSEVPTDIDHIPSNWAVRHY